MDDSLYIKMSNQNGVSKIDYGEMKFNDEL